MIKAVLDSNDPKKLCAATVCYVSYRFEEEAHRVPRHRLPIPALRVAHPDPAPCLAPFLKGQKDRQQIQHRTLVSWDLPGQTRFWIGRGELVLSYVLYTVPLRYLESEGGLLREHPLYYLKIQVELYTTA